VQPRSYASHLLLPLGPSYIQLLVQLPPNFPWDHRSLSPWPIPALPISPGSLHRPAYRPPHPSNFFLACVAVLG
jgi:hypothetical protein